MTENLPVEKANTIMALFEGKALRAQIARAIPEHLTVDRLLRVAMTAIRTNPKLLECTQESLLACVMGCAALGLEPEPFLGQAYLVPYFNKKKNCTEAQLIPGYRGYIALARRSGEVQSLSSQVVYTNDRFKIQYGIEEVLEHEPADGERGDVKGVYVVFKYKDGSYSFDYMSKEDVDKIRKRSKSSDRGPWVTDYDEMAKKTVIRRHVKVAPLSVELSKAATAENLSLAGESQISFLNPDNSIPEAETVKPEDFDNMISDEVDLDLLAQFITKTAEANGVTVDEIKIEAAKAFDGFMESFETWKATQSKPQATIDDLSELYEANNSDLIDIMQTLDMVNFPTKKADKEKLLAEYNK